MRAPPSYALDDPELRGAFRSPVVAMGMFDGVHRGHEKVVELLVDRARSLGGDPVVVTFASHPRRVLGQEDPPLLTTLEHRILLLGRAGVAGVVVLHFDRGMANWSPEEFVQRVFVDALSASAVLVGENHRFGKDRRGDFALLRQLGEQHGFAAEEVALARLGEVISSTAIRQQIAAGDLAAAAELLGRPVSLLAEVARGDQRGRTLGFPTANLALEGAARPPRGVYAARARIVAADGAIGPRLPAVVNIGRRPTFKDGVQELIEVHLLEGGRDLYGLSLEVEFVTQLRDERRFNGPAELKAQIQRDVAAARDVLVSSG